MSLVSGPIYTSLIKVVFVSEGPTEGVLLQDVPLVGSRGLLTVAAWLRVLQPDYYLTLTVDELDKVAVLAKAGFRVLSLGPKAHTRLKRAFIDHCSLPAPSRMHSQIKDREKTAEALANAKAYIRGSRSIDLPNL